MTTLIYFLLVAPPAVFVLMTLLVIFTFDEERSRELSDGSDNQHEHITEYIP